MEEKYQQALESLKAFAETHNGKFDGHSAKFILNGCAVKEACIRIKPDFKSMGYLYSAHYTWYSLPSSEVEKVNAMEFKTPSEAYTIIGRAQAINKFFNEL